MGEPVIKFRTVDASGNPIEIAMPRSEAIAQMQAQGGALTYEYPVSNVYVPTQQGYQVEPRFGRPTGAQPLPGIGGGIAQPPVPPSEQKSIETVENLYQKAQG